MFESIGGGIWLMPAFGRYYKLAYPTDSCLGFCWYEACS